MHHTSIAMCTPHAEYLALEKSDEARLAAYRGLFGHPESGALLADVRRALNQGLVLGNERFKEQVALTLKRNTCARPVGRPGKARREQRGEI